MSRVKFTTVVVCATTLLVLCSSVGALSASGDPSAYNLTESEYLTLESGSLLPYADVVTKIERELQAIRTKFPAVGHIQHHQKWVPGQVLTTSINQEQVKRLNESSYGPLVNVEKIDVMPFFFVTILTFKQPYSPPVLAQMLQEEFGFSATPNTVYYEYEVDDVGHRIGSATYVFKKGTGMCKDNCPERQLWEFTIGEGNNVTLVKEWTVPQNGERVIIY